MKKNMKSIVFYIALFALILIVATFMYQGPATETKVYSDLVKEIQSGGIKQIVVNETMAAATRIDNTEFTVTIPSVDILYSDVGESIKRQIDAGTLKFIVPEKVESPWWLSLLPGVFLVIIFIVFWIMMLGGKDMGGKGAMSFGKSRAKIANPDTKKVKFEDVAGEDEEKEELMEVVDFLKNPQKFEKMGARIPKGVLLVGPPGTGKTLLAKAVAGEAGVPFFSISGSDFVEMFVGVGASRVRDLFEQAKKNAPCIVFKSTSSANFFFLL